MRMDGASGPACNCCGRKRDIHIVFHHCFKCHSAGCESLPFNGRTVKRCKLDAQFSEIRRKAKR